MLCVSSERIRKVLDRKSRTEGSYLGKERLGIASQETEAKGRKPRLLGLETILILCFGDNERRAKATVNREMEQSVLFSDLR